MYNTHPLLAAVAVSIHRHDDVLAEHARVALRERRASRRRWRKARTLPTIRIAAAPRPQPGQEVVWLG